MVKISGAEFKRFYNDRSLWVNGAFHEETLIMSNGVEIDYYDDIEDSAAITIKGGFVSDDTGRGSR